MPSAFWWAVHYKIKTKVLTIKKGEEIRGLCFIKLLWLRSLKAPLWWSTKSPAVSYQPFPWPPIVVPQVLVELEGNPRTCLDVVLDEVGTTWESGEHILGTVDVVPQFWCCGGLSPQTLCPKRSLNWINPVETWGTSWIVKSTEGIMSWFWLSLSMTCWSICLSVWLKYAWRPFVCRGQELCWVSQSSLWWWKSGLYFDCRLWVCRGSCLLCLLLGVRAWQASLINSFMNWKILIIFQMQS